MKKSDQEYRQMLSDMEYRVTREAATERPFTGKYWDHWDKGRYSCICCGTPLFYQKPSLMLGVAGQAITRPRIKKPSRRLKIPLME